jgi:hypothetical protein
VQLGDQSGCLVEAQLLACDDDALPGMGQINAPAERNAFDIFGRNRLPWNVRQTPVSLPLGTFSPEPH